MGLGKVLAIDEGQRVGKEEAMGAAEILNRKRGTGRMAKQMKRPNSAGHSPEGQPQIEPIQGDSKRSARGRGAREGLITANAHTKLDTDRLHLANFIEIARSLPDQCVDLIVADPPYNASKGGAWSWDRSAGLPGFGGNWKKVAEVWDDMSLEEYFSFTMGWLEEVKRILRPTGSIWVHGTYHNSGIINFAMQRIHPV